MANKATKFIKQYFFMLALMATVVGFSAFKYAQKSERQETWYYQSDSMDPLALQNPENYEANPPGDINCEPDEEIVCSISDAENSDPALAGHPQLTHGNVLTNPQYQTSFREQLN